MPSFVSKSFKKTAEGAEIHDNAFEMRFGALRAASWAALGFRNDVWLSAGDILAPTWRFEVPL